MDSEYTAKIRVAAYARVSTGKDAQLESLDTQREHYEEYIRSNPEWQYAGVYCDDGISGTKTKNRAGLNRLIEGCEKGRIQHVITKSISRLARNTVDCLEIIQRLKAVKVSVYFEKENLNTKNANDELMISIMAGFAQEESKSIAENVRWSNRKKFEAGDYKLSSAPYGYKLCNGNLVIDPEEAEIVKRIYREYNASKPVRAIIRDLNNEHILPKKGKEWSAISIVNITKNEKYTGDCILQKTYTDSNYKKCINCGEVDQYIWNNHHEAIITKEEFDIAQKLRILRHQTRIKNAQIHEKSVFSKKIICGECGKKYERSARYYEGSCNLFYKCRTHSSNSEKCKNQPVSEIELKATYATVMNKLLYGMKIVLKPYCESLKNKVNDTKVGCVDDEIKEVKTQIENIQSLWTNGYLDSDFYHRVISEHEESLKSKVINRASSIDEDEYIYRRDEANDLVRYLSSGKWQGEFTDEAFTLFVDHIVVNKKNDLTFCMKCGLELRERVVEGCC